MYTHSSMLCRLLVVAAGFLFPVLYAADWPAYRGPGANGVGQGAAPASWNGDANSGPLRNIKWKTQFEGLGHSSPVIIGGKLFVTTAISSAGKAPLKVGLYGSGDSADDEAEQEWVVYCLDKLSGKVLWRQIAHRGKPRARRHTKATHANTTVATDAKRVIVFFGSEGLYSYTLDGRLEWQKDLGLLDMAPSDERTLSWGFASSPVLFEDTVIVQCDSKKDGFLAAFAAADGHELWRVPASLGVSLQLGHARCFQNRQPDTGCGQWLPLHRELRFQNGQRALAFEVGRRHTRTNTVHGSRIDLRRQRARRQITVVRDPAGSVRRHYSRIRLPYQCWFGMERRAQRLLFADTRGVRRPSLRLDQSGHLQGLRYSHGAQAV